MVRSAGAAGEPEVKPVRRHDRALATGTTGHFLRSRVVFLEIYI